MPRLNKLDFYMQTAILASKRATCPRGSVGAILVKDDRIIATGYNGAPHKSPHCFEVGCLMYEINGKKHCARAVHSEINTVLNAAFFGVPTHGAVLYCTHRPCLNCVKMLIQAGVYNIWYKNEYIDPATDFFIRENKKLKIRKYERSTID